jgi:GNAT superfamily N-acetyltransferase
VLSGEPVADFNYAIVDAHPNAEDQLRDFVGLARSKHLPLVVIVSEEAGDSLEPVAKRLRLHFAGRLPLMTSAVAPGPTTTPFDVASVRTTSDLAESNQLIASAFALPPESVDRVFTSALLEAPGGEAFIVRQSGIPMSSVQTTRAGATVGIWSMATPPEHRRKGAGRAALAHAMASHASRGATLFYLLATEAGKPLYEHIGFRRISDAAIWVDGHSTQAPTGTPAA